MKCPNCSKGLMMTKPYEKGREDCLKEIKKVEKFINKQEMEIWKEVKRFCVGKNIGEFRVFIVHRFNGIRDKIKELGK